LGCQRCSGSPKIVDLLSEGTSLRLTQSSDFTAYLARHQYSIQELIEGMRQLTNSTSPTD
jgi:ABC-type transporter MlaC component